MAYVGRKGARAALIHADIPENLNLLGDYVKIPSVTTTQRDALTAAVGMLVYNSTIGMLQQYNAVGWQAIDSPPTITSFTYPDSATALDPAGSTTATLVITGSNFSVGATVLIDGTAPTATTRNSVTQITITGYPAKAAATYSAGLKVTNASGLSASVDIIYDALPTWTTAAGSLGSFVDGTYTNSSGSPTAIRIVAAEGSDTIDYAQVSDATGDTVITSGVAGLTLGTTGANAGYLTGALSGDESSTYNFYAKPTDDEGQVGAVRLFNIISAAAATGGTTINIDDWVSNYKIHVFNIADTGTDFVVNTNLTCDILVVAGGGSGGGDSGGGGGGAGGVLFNSSANKEITNTAISLSPASYTITVGIGGVYVEDAQGVNGGNSVFTGGGITYTAIGGGGGGQGSPASDGNDGGSGGGGRYNQSGGSGTAGQGTDGGDGKVGNTVTGGGGGGALLAGTSPAGNQTATGDGGSGKDYSSKYGTVVGEDSGYFAGGGGSGSETAEGGQGALGGGGKGGKASTYAAIAGSANTGGGGGGAYTSGASGASGGSGVVIIRYAV